ncbi:hypothetical protein RJ53_04470 [Methanocalculus chunghsingensis]|uniref:Membrane-spanning protein n=1 Tax=Methanocalculus chunghsingensis TaxID=156457 RepID=A0A8J8B567_9EURY|nr:hypothetical protein [Methanocalculus chunghsingensis]MBR1368803.1 hypothetical protein [Methanocalculus chunghsingensis]
MNIKAVEPAAVILMQIILIGYLVQAYLHRDMFRVLFVLLTITLILIPFGIAWYLSIDLPTGTKAAVALALLIHSAGGIARYYWIYAPWYDKIAHSISGFALGLIIFSIYLILSLRGVEVRPTGMYLGIIILVFLLGAVWEIGELFIDSIFHSSYNHGYTDTVFDMIANTIGSLLAVAYARHLTLTIPNGEKLSVILTRNR